MSKRSDEHSLRRALIAQELHRRAGGDINKILPAMDDMLTEAREKREAKEAEDADKDFSDEW